MKGRGKDVCVEIVDEDQRRGRGRVDETVATSMKGGRVGRVAVATTEDKDAVDLELLVMLLERLSILPHLPVETVFAPRHAVRLVKEEEAATARPEGRGEREGKTRRGGMTQQEEHL